MASSKITKQLAIMGDTSITILDLPNIKSIKDVIEFKSSYAKSDGIIQFDDVGGTLTIIFSR